MAIHIKIIIILCILFQVGIVSEIKSQTNYYVSPEASGRGDGSSPSDAAYYLNSSFWVKIQNNLKSDDVNVLMLDGIYNSGTLTLNYMGNPQHKLTVCAVNEGQVEMWVNSETLYHINMRGTQNATIQGITFKGDCKNFSVACWAGGKKTARNIQIINCRFENLTNAYYGGIYFANADNVLVKGCTFFNVGSGAHAHMIYSDKYCRNLAIVNSSFTNCKGDYVRFRNDTGYAKVDSCSFSSTYYTYNHAFILIPVFNDVNPGDEFLATDFQFTNNSFSYSTGGGRCHAVQFHSDGYNVTGGLDYWTSPAEGTTLNYGTVSEKEAVLNTMGLFRSRVIVYGNTYSRVDRKVVFWHHQNYGSSHQGYTGYCNISDWPSTEGEVAVPPVIINGDFEMPGYYLRYWNKPSTFVHPGLNGTNTSVLFDQSSASQELYHWLNNAPSKWTMEAFFAIGNHNAAETLFKIEVGHNDLDDSRLSVGINRNGEIGIYDQNNFRILPELGKIEFSLDLNNNNNYLDEDDKLMVYRIRIKGDYTATNPNVTIELSEANENNFSKKTSPLSYWVKTPPSVGIKPSMLTIFSDKCASLIDEINFTETDVTSSADKIFRERIIGDSRILVYPNPLVDGILRIKFQEIPVAPAIISIYNITGNLVDEIRFDSIIINQQEQTIDLKHLPKNSYLVKIKSGNAVLNTLIVKT